jgi:AcrR family transcriptional regulator
MMGGGVPLPGTAKARLIAAAIRRFEEHGFDAVTVQDLASDADVTTGSLYHHFGSKLGLYLVVREEMETRIVERMEGAAAAAGRRGRRAVLAALRVAFDAALQFRVPRILSEPRPEDGDDPVERALASFLPARAGSTASVLAAAWRGALSAVVAGTPPVEARRAVTWLLAG